MFCRKVKLPVSDKIFSSFEMKSKLAAHPLKSWREGVARLCNASFQIYQTKRQPSTDRVYDNCAASETFMVARTNFLPLKWCARTFDDLGHGKLCPLCFMDEETFNHFLYECAELSLKLTVMEETNGFIGLQKSDEQAAITLLGFKQISTTVAENYASILAAKSYVWNRWSFRTEFFAKLNFESH